MKKAIIFFILLLILSSTSIRVYADDEDEEIEERDLESIQTSIESKNELKINSRAAVIYDRTSKTIIWGKKENEKRAMASTTKIMTAIIVLENANLKDTVSISKKAALTGGSRLKLSENDKITVNDLLYGLMLRSGNDAAVALAEHVGGSVEGFANLMNEKARTLNLFNTHFVTPHGLDSSEHYTTAYELALITDYALQNSKFATIVNTKTTNIYVNGISRTISNTNELLGNLNGVNGVKTGFTNNALRCLVTSTTRNGHQIICVVLGADTKKIRTQDSIKLIEYAFANYEYINIKEKIEAEFKEFLKNDCGKIKIKKAKNTLPQFELTNISNEELPIKKEEIYKINTSIQFEDYIEAPTNINQIIGSIHVTIDELQIASADIIIKNEIQKKTMLDNFFEILTNYTNCLESCI